MVLSLKKVPKAYKNKFENFFTNYKEANVRNNFCRQSRHDCKYYDNFDSWWSESGSIMKHMSALQMIARQILER